MGVMACAERHAAAGTDGAASTTRLHVVNQCSTGYTGEIVAIHENNPDLGREAIAAAVERHRQATGYRGTVVVLDETDRAL